MTIDYCTALPRGFAWLVLSCGLLAGAPAAAHQHHHPVPEPVVSEEGDALSATADRPVLATSVMTESAGYVVDGHRGNYLLTAVGVEYSPLPWLALSAHAPFAYLAPEGGDAELGVGDVGAGVRAELYRSEGGGLSLAAGLGAMVPTGDEAVGLGSGHWMLAPSLMATASPGDGLLFVLEAADAFPISGQNHHDHEAMGMGSDEAMKEQMGEVGLSLVTPHNPHELRVRTGIVQALGPVQGGIHGQVVVPWSEPEPLGPVTVGADAGWSPAGPLRLAASFDLPVTDARYFDWKAGMSATLSF